MCKNPPPLNGVAMAPPVPVRARTLVQELVSREGKEQSEDGKVQGGNFGPLEACLGGQM